MLQIALTIRCGCSLASNWAVTSARSRLRSSARLASFSHFLLEPNEEDRRDAVSDSFHELPIFLAVVRVLVRQVPQSNHLALEQDRHNQVPRDGNESVGDRGRRIGKQNPLLQQRPAPKALPLFARIVNALVRDLTLRQELGHGGADKRPVVVDIAEHAVLTAGCFKHRVQRLANHDIAGLLDECSHDAVGQRYGAILLCQIVLSLFVAVTSVNTTANWPTAGR